ncbi:MAG: sn-glycerol-3-phosphate ABC transporter ATP-binding protein UgpC [Actinomycetota bacterium]
MAAVVLKNVRKEYREQEAVRDFSLEIEDNELVVLVGPSGCGKTTTLRMIAGLEDITAGEIYIDGRLVNEVPPKDRDIAMVFQNYALYPNMTVYDNLAFGLKLRKEAKPAIRQRVMDIAQLLDIERYLDRKPAKLSGGERQRVAIGRALVRKPKVFLMDEPLSNLDAKLRNTMRAEILKLHRRIKATIIYVTHDQVEAMTLGDRIVVMRDGLIQQVGNPEDIYVNPINKYVAEFIGSPPMNFLPAMLVEEAGCIYAHLSGSGHLIRLPDSMIPSPLVRAFVGGEVILGIRPEHILINPSVMESNGFEMELDVVERMGSETHLHLRLGPADIIARTTATAAFTVGELLKIELPPERVFIFDVESEENILAAAVTKSP